MDEIRFVVAAYALSGALIGAYAWTLGRRLKRARGRQ
jgi:CcmD family protein